MYHYLVSDHCGGIVSPRPVATSVPDRMTIVDEGVIMLSPIYPLDLIDSQATPDLFPENGRTVTWRSHGRTSRHRSGGRRSGRSRHGRRGRSGHRR